MKQTDILALGFFIIGNYKETREDMLRIADNAAKAGLDFISVGRLLCYPKTELHGIIQKLPDYHIGDRNIVYSDYYAISDLNRIRKEINRRFYSATHLARIIFRFSYHFNLPKVIRQIGLEFILKGIFKKQRQIDRLLYLTSRYNILYPVDLLLNSILRIGGRIFEYAISRRGV